MSGPNANPGAGDPSLAMDPQPSVAPNDPATAEPTTVVVDGQIFSVRPSAQAGSFDYTWLNGSPAGYGFTSRSSAGGSRTMAEHVESIRDFLEMVAPTADHLELHDPT